jgi:hypothetical protein
VIWTVLDVPDGTVPSAHVTVPEAFVQPAEADTNVTDAGSVSTTWTSAASAVPPLDTTRVYTRFCPTVAGSGESVFESARFAGGST